MLRLIANNTAKMSRCSEQNGIYSDEILAGIVDLIHVCAEWARSPADPFRDMRIDVQEDMNTWQLVNAEVVEVVNQALYLKYQDWEFVARVWKAVYHEKPEILTLDNTSGSSHATIYTRTASQQRISIYAFRALVAVEAGDFNHSRYKPPALPSLALFQRLQNDNYNDVMCEAVGMLNGTNGTINAITLEELGPIAPGGHIFVHGLRPLGEVMLPFERQDMQEMMATEQCAERFAADHAALVQKMDAHFKEAGYGAYYTAQSGPPMVKNMYNDAMSLLPFTPVVSIPMANECCAFHFFWRRDFDSCACNDTSISARVATMSID